MSSLNFPDFDPLPGANRAGRKRRVSGPLVPAQPFLQWIHKAGCTVMTQQPILRVLAQPFLQWTHKTGCTVIHQRVSLHYQTLRSSLLLNNHTVCANNKSDKCFMIEAPVQSVKPRFNDSFRLGLVLLNSRPFDCIRTDQTIFYLFRFKIVCTVTVLKACLSLHFLLPCA